MIVRLTRASVAFALALGAKNIEEYIKIMEATNGVGYGVCIVNNRNYRGGDTRNMDDKKERKMER
ncbi:MAG: hypothetical protein LBQ18_01115 [Campylobacteraceae bacterium]|jgi:hypothetical protein|nr:hypothetical protein [Campylobacteraceae bacterium]